MRRNDKAAIRRSPDRACSIAALSLCLKRRQGRPVNSLRHAGLALVPGSARLQSTPRLTRFENCQHEWPAISPMIGRARPVESDRKVGFSAVGAAFDNADLFGECVHTQIKRAYELSVCIARLSFMRSTRALTGVPGAGGHDGCGAAAIGVYSSASISWRSVDDLRR